MRIMRAVVCAMCVLTSTLTSAAHAVVVESVSCGAGRPDICLTGIKGLEVSGTLYNVRLIEDSFENLFGDPLSPDFVAPTFWEDEATAVAVLTAIGDLMAPNGLSLFRMDNTGTVWGDVLIHYDIHPFLGAATSDVLVRCGIDFLGDLCDPTVITDFASSYEDIRPTALISVVPVPAALPLFLSAIAILGWFGWRRANSA